MIYSDYKPLISIFENPNSHCSARLERWRLRLQSYDFQVRYRPGHDNSSNIGADQPPFLGVCRDVQRDVQASTGCRTN